MFFLFFFSAILLQVSVPKQYNSLNQDPVGALSSTFARLQSSKPLRELRGMGKYLFNSISHDFDKLKT